MLTSSAKPVSCRTMAELLGVDKNTACYMNMRLRRAMLTDHAFLKELISWNVAP